MKKYRVKWNEGASTYVIAENEISAMLEVQRKYCKNPRCISAEQVSTVCEPESHTGIIYMTVWNTSVYKDYQGHSIVELSDNLRSEHTRKAADWIMETLGEGDYRCIVKVNIVGRDVSFKMIDSKTIKE